MTIDGSGQNSENRSLRDLALEGKKTTVIQNETATRFIEECQALNYEPTSPEVEMYFSRYNQMADASGLAWSLKQLGITGKEVELVGVNVGKWGKEQEILGKPDLELASNLMTGLLERMEQLKDGYLIEETRDTRNVLIRGGTKTSRYPTEKTITFFLSKRRRRLPNPLVLLETLKFKNLFRKTLDRFNFSSGIMARKDLEKTTGDCLITFIQEGGKPYVKKGVVAALSYLYGFMGLERYASEEVVTSALERVDQAIEPLRPDLLRIINGAIGLPPKNN